VPIEPVVLVEARVLRGDDSMLEMGEIWLSGMNVVAFANRACGCIRLEAALGCATAVVGGSIHSAATRSQRGKRPRSTHGDDKPLKKRSEKLFPSGDLGGVSGLVVHTSE